LRCQRSHEGLHLVQPTEVTERLHFHQPGLRPRIACGNLQGFRRRITAKQKPGKVEARIGIARIAQEMAAESGFGRRVIAHVEQQGGALEPGRQMVLVAGKRCIECGERKGVLVLTAQDKAKIVMKACMAAIARNQAPQQCFCLWPVLPPQGLLQLVQVVNHHCPPTRRRHPRLSPPPPHRHTRVTLFTFRCMLELLIALKGITMNKALLIAGTSLVAMALSTSAMAEPVFNRIASFPVAQTLPEGADPKTPTSAEIITATADGMTLIFSDSPGKRIAFIDITDPRQPKAAGSLALDGEPTSVAAVGKMVLVGLNTSKSKTEPSGALLAVDAAGKTIGTSCDLGGQPDSVAVSPDGSIAAVAVENERDEDLNDGKIPQMPAGNVQIFTLKDGVPDCAGKITAAVTGLAAVAGDDPEPEYVDISASNEIAVTLQENNHIAVLDATGKVISHFSAGGVDLTGIDTKRDGALNFTGEKKGQLREPDTVQWLDGDRLLTANEGDYEGGSRSFTIFSKTGEVLFEAGSSLEHMIALHGHYPDRRNSKGNEPEGAEAKAFGGTNYIFVLSERSSVISVFKDTGAEPQFSQILPSGLSPEGIIAIPGRNLIAVANEVDLVEDGGVRSHVTLYELAEGTPAYPSIVSVKDGNGAPIGWGALSGLAADPEKPGMMYAVNDSFYSGQPMIFSIDATKKPAVITSALPITRNGNAAQLLDIEGIAADGKGGFWLASEGRGDQMIPHGILHVNDKGEIDQTIGLPDELLRGASRFGFEGITITGSGDDTVLWMAVQREWADDEKGTVKLVSYAPKDKAWGAVRYPLEKAEEGWVGLSEITAHGDYFYIVERDNQIGQAAKIKRLYRVAKAEMVPGKIGEALPLVKKELVRDLLPDLLTTGGYALEKVEGFAIDAAGEGFAVTDNDGVNESNGETLFWSIGKM